jgi:acetyl-CoA C-acetyltransferase
MREAVRGGLEATQIDPKDVEVGHVGNFAAELYAMQGHLGAFLVDLDPAFSGLPTARHEAACASGSIALLAASAEIEAGRYDLAMVVGVEQMKTVDPAKGGDFLGTAAWYEREAKGVEFPFPKLFGRLGDEYDKRFGLKDEHLAHISAVNYSNAKRNPNAQTRTWYMTEDHARSQDKFNSIIGGRIKVSDCSQVTDGAASLFLASEKYAAQYAKRRGIKLESIPRLLGWGHHTAPIEFSAKVAESAGNKYVLPHTRQTILDAFKRAGVADCWGVDAIETHDCFTTSEYMAIDHFGLTAPGESWKAIEEGVIEMGGKLPINPSGGLIGCGHPVGATGTRQVLDAYAQVLGQCGEYQVDGAKKVATLNIGGSGTTSVAFVVGV